MPDDKYLETIKKFRLIDDTFFSACFDNNEQMREQYRPERDIILQCWTIIN